MMRDLLVMIGFALISTQSLAQNNWAKVTPESVPRVQVILDDEATGACWTNLSEVRDYAEEKLRINGYSTVEAADWWFYIETNAWREESGVCTGAIMVHLTRFVASDGGALKVVAAEINGAGITEEGGNFNRLIIEYIRALIDEL